MITAFNSTDVAVLVAGVVLGPLAFTGTHASLVFIYGNFMRVNFECDRIVDGVQVVPEGIHEIVRLQTQDGFAYFKP